MKNKDYIDTKELESLDDLTVRYNKLIKPSTISKLNNKVKKSIPKQIKRPIYRVGSNLSENNIYKSSLDFISTGYKEIEKQAVRFSISQSAILKSYKSFEIESFDEINTLKSYDISEIINKYKTKDLLLALSEGAATGDLGFSGLPFNLVLSNFLYFRAVQSIAMYYGYDVKNDPSELVIASSVYTNALSPSNSDLNNELSASIAKIVLISKATIIQQTSKKNMERHD